MLEKKFREKFFEKTFRKYHSKIQSVIFAKQLYFEKNRDFLYFLLFCQFFLIFQKKKNIDKLSFFRTLYDSRVAPNSVCRF